MELTKDNCRHPAETVCIYWSPAGDLEIYRCTLCGQESIDPMSYYSQEEVWKLEEYYYGQRDAKPIRS